MPMYGIDNNIIWSIWSSFLLALKLLFGYCWCCSWVCCILLFKTMFLYKFLEQSWILGTNWRSIRIVGTTVIQLQPIPYPNGWVNPWLTFIQWRKWVKKMYKNVVNLENNAFLADTWWESQGQNGPSVGTLFRKVENCTLVNWHSCGKSPSLIGN